MKLRQKETEMAVNDFLATFSSLYDDMPVDERTKVLDSVPLPEEGISDSGDDEDNSESESSRSSPLVDD